MPAIPGLTQQEIDKLDIDPNIDFREIAVRPFKDLTPNEIGMFKWSGVYHQLQKGYFMMRLRMPGGVLTSVQMRRAGELASQYGQDELCITTRQCLQYHWLRKEDIFKVIEGMKEVGVLTTNACGDVCRNVVGCPLQGVCKYEIGETSEMLRRIADDPELLYDQRNLPRKHKINVVGCGSSCGMELMNCQGWHPVERKSDDGSMEIGWKLLAGGGLGSLPHMGKPIFDWVPEDLVVDVSRAVVEAHRRYGNRRKRKYARLKIIVAKFGAEGFGKVLLDLMRERNIRGLERIEFALKDDPELNVIAFEGEGVIPEKRAGKNTVRIMIPRSEFRSANAECFARWADMYGDGTMIFTQRQNLQLRGIDDKDVETLVAEIHAAGFRTDGFEHLPDLVSCVGTTMCNLAVSDTPKTYRSLCNVFAEDREFWKAVGPLRINMNGCPNSCGHHWIADIGLRGRRIKRDEGSEEGFSVFVGGRLDGKGHIGEFVMDISASDAVQAVRVICEVYIENRLKNERFNDFANRLGGDGVAALVDGKNPEFSPHEPVNLRNLQLDEDFRKAFEESITK